MTEPVGRERRSAPRVRARLTVATAAEDQSFAMETLDISVSGAYCLVDRFVPLMTRVRLAIEIPLAGRDALIVKAQGIVVRIEPQERAIRDEPGYRLALFFSDVEEIGRQALEQFVGNAWDRSREI